MWGAVRVLLCPLVLVGAFADWLALSALVERPTLPGAESLIGAIGPVPHAPSRQSRISHPPR